MSTEAEQIPLETQLANAKAEIAGLKAHAALAHDALLAVEEYWSGGTFEHDLYADREMRRGVQDVLAKTPADAGAELAALRRDKERLEWLTRNWESQYEDQPIADTRPYPNPTGNVRDAIDAAMKQSTKWNT
jgi:hypothetical protein